jgi:hypothetical protein
MAVQLTQRLFATITLVILAVGAAAAIMAFGTLSNNRSIQSYGTVKAINVGVYWNSGCTNVTSTVNWGMLSPGTSKDFTIYVKNEGNVAMKLSLVAQNWSPTNAPSYMTLSWNREGQSVNSGSVLSATLSLSVSSSISGITSFSFDIIITGTEQ